MVHNIATPSLSDEGIYTCLAQNSLGEAIQEVTIRFRGHPSAKYQFRV